MKKDLELDWDQINKEIWVGFFILRMISYDNRKKATWRRLWPVSPTYKSKFLSFLFSIKSEIVSFETGYNP